MGRLCGWGGLPSGRDIAVSATGDTGNNVSQVGQQAFPLYWILHKPRWRVVKAVAVRPQFPLNPVPVLSSRRGQLALIVIKRRSVRCEVESGENRDRQLPVLVQISLSGFGENGRCDEARATHLPPPRSLPVPARINNRNGRTQPVKLV